MLCGAERAGGRRYTRSCCDGRTRHDGDSSVVTGVWAAEVGTTRSRDVWTQPRADKFRSTRQRATEVCVCVWSHQCESPPHEVDDAGRRESKDFRIRRPGLFWHANGNTKYSVRCCARPRGCCTCTHVLGVVPQPGRSWLLAAQRRSSPELRVVGRQSRWVLTER